MDGNSTISGSTAETRPHSLLVRLLLSVVLCFGLVAGTGDVPAFAGGLGGLPIAIGDGEAGAGVAAEGMAACAATTVAAVGCVAASALVIGLWQTRNSWMPVVKNFLTSSLAPVLGSAPGSCAMNDSVVVGAGVGGGGVTFTWSGSGSGCPASNAAARVYSIGKVVCQNTATGAVSQVAAPSYYGDPYLPASGNGTFYPCGTTGFVVLFAQIGMEMLSQPSTSPVYVFGGPYASAGTVPPASMVSQTSTVTCTLPSGSNVTVSQTQVGQPGALVIPSCQAAYPGSVPVNLAVTGGWPGAEQPVMNQALTPRASLLSQYPGCFDANGAFLPATCQTKVWINGQPCAVGVGHCANWTSAAQDYGDSVSCQFGAYTVPVAECMQYLTRAYAPGAPTQNLTRLSPSGTPVDQSDPSAEPGTGDAAATAPDPTGQTCPSLNLSWNIPGDIVNGVEVALCNMFVPTSTPNWAALQNPIPPGWMPSFATLSDGSCGALTFPSMSFGRVGGSTSPVTFVNTCNAPWPQVQAVTYNGLLVIAMIVIGRRIFFSILTAFGMAVDKDAGFISVSADD